MWMAVELHQHYDCLDTIEALQVCADMVKACCGDPSSLSFHKWMSQASPSNLALAKKSWTASIVCTERDHGRNQRVERAKQGRLARGAVRSPVTFAYCLACVIFHVMTRCQSVLQFTRAYRAYALFVVLRADQQAVYTCIK